MTSVDERIISILDSFLGEYEKSSNGWYSYNCPYCADMNGGEPDNKYNLEIYIDPNSRGCGGYHCWKCGDTNGTKGKLSDLIRKHSNSSTYETFVKEIKEYRKTRLYELGDGSELAKEFDDDDLVSLPLGCKQINKGSEAYKYLKGRGITDFIINEYGLLQLDSSGKNKQYRNRIVIPSYDRYDVLNYWVGRDYTGTSNRKVINAKTSKTDIIFNESKINWYEPITLVEGPFDHIVTPNSIPLLGKSLNEEYALYDALFERSKSDIRIFLDDDAIKNAYKIYRLLNKGKLEGRVYVVDTPNGYDPSLIFQEYGKDGILNALCSARRINEFEYIGL